MMEHGSMCKQLGVPLMGHKLLLLPEDIAAFADARLLAGCNVKRTLHSDNISASSRMESMACAADRDFNSLLSVQPTSATAVLTTCPTV